MQTIRFSLLAPCLMLALFLSPTAADAKRPNRGESSLVRVLDAVDEDARGRIRVRSHKNDERFEVKALDIDSDEDTLVELYLEGDILGEMILVDVLRRAGGQDGEGTYHYRARRRRGVGDLPFGVMKVSELAGLRAEIWLDGQPLLEGIVPGTTHEKSARAEVQLDATVEAPEQARARLRLFSVPKKGSESFRLKVVQFPLMVGEALHLFVEDPDDALGTLVDQGPLVEDEGEGGEHHFRLGTRMGDPMPFGLAGVADLEGLMLEIRNAAGDVVYFEGVVPALD
jgi:hypothetical protein